MENIVKMISDKAGISESQAKTALDTVVNFLKDKLPSGMGSQLDSLVSGGGTTNEGGMGDLKDKLGGFMNKG